jgi:hypothetical protein
MDMYFERHLKENFPELDNWAMTPMQDRLEIYEALTDRGRAWVQIYLMRRPEKAQEIWQHRECDNTLHHACPDCGSTPEAVGSGMSLVCLNTQCSNILNSWDPENAHPWMGHNHVRPSDESCGGLRWDVWDN